MAESYIITIRFAPSKRSLDETEKRLNSVFDRVTKRFKNGFAKVTKGFKFGASIAAIGTALAHVLNPLSALNDRINATLDKAGNIKDRAQGAGTDIKTYLAVQGYAQSKGVNEEALLQAMSRMQVLIGEAKAGNANVLSNYAGETPMGKVFYNVMNQLAKIQDPAKRAKMASDVFGQRAIASLGPLVSEGFVEKDFRALFAGINMNKAQGAVENLDARGDQQARLQIRRELEDMVNKGKLITEDAINLQDKRERAKLALENKQLAAYESLADIDSKVDEIKRLLSNLYKLLSFFLEGVRMSIEGYMQFPKLISEMKDHMEIIRNRLPSWLGGKKNENVRGGGR